MQLRNVSKRLLAAAVTLFLPLQVAAQATQGPAEEKIREYDANAQFDQELAEPDWIPSLRLGLGVNHQGVASNLKTLPFTDRISGFAHEEGIVRGPFNPEGPRATQPDEGCVLPFCPPLSFLGPIDGSNPVDGPSIAGGFEIMGPAIEDLLGKPRPFFVFDYRDQLRGSIATVREQTRFDNNRPVGCENSFCIDEEPNNKRIVAEGNVDQKFWLLAGVGTAFQLPIAGYNLKLKPSLNYFYSRSVVQSILTQGIRESPTADPLTQNLTAEEHVTNHGIAPRIEFDAEIYRDGPLSIGFFLAVDFLMILSGPLDHQVDTPSCFIQSQNFEDADISCARISDPNDPAFQSSGVLSYTLERDRLTYQGTAGLRFSWMGGP